MGQEFTYSQLSGPLIPENKVGRFQYANRHHTRQLKVYLVMYLRPTFNLAAFDTESNEISQDLRKKNSFGPSQV